MTGSKRCARTDRSIEANEREQGFTIETLKRAGEGQERMSDVLIEALNASSKP